MILRVHIHFFATTLKEADNKVHFQFLEGDMSLSKLCQLRSGASRAYSTAVGKEVVIVGCARSLYHTK